MNYSEYFKGTDYLENREEKLFDIISRMEREASKIYDEVLDLNINSYYKVDNLLIRINHLCDMIDQITDCYEYLKEIEIEGFLYAGRRLLFKRLLTAFVSAFAMFVNILMGVLSYFTLSTMANKYYANEIGDISLKVDRYYKYDLEKLSRILHSCEDLLQRKMNKYFSREEQQKVSKDIIDANYILISFLNNQIDIEDILDFTEEEKNAVIKVLQNDLKSDSDDLSELLNILKKQNDEELKLTKDIN